MMGSGCVGACLQFIHWGQITKTMKTTLLIATLLFSVFATTVSAQSLYDTYDDVRTVQYGFDVPFSEQQGNGTDGTVWPGWSGTLIQYEANPGPSALNDSPMCVQYARNSGEFYDVIIVHPGLLADLADYVSGAKTMSFDVYSPLPGITVQITLENQLIAEAGYPTGRHSEYLAVTTTGGQWETLEFELSLEPWTDPVNVEWWPTAAEANVDVDQMVILFNPASNSGDVYFMDNLSGPERVVEPCTESNTNASVLLDADCENDRWVKEYCDGRMSIFPDPLDGDNMVIEYARNGGAADDVIVGNFDGALEIPENSILKIDILESAAPSAIALSLQDAFGLELALFDLTSTVSGEWQTFEMDLAAIAGLPNVTHFVILFSPGELIPDVYYIDNLILETTISVDEVATAGFAVFPNPAANEVNIQLDASLEVSSVAVLNLSGQTVINTTLTNSKLDVSSLSPGVYIVKLTLMNGEVISERILID
ncbi:MAG: hypothetical protein ACI898_000247 [Flavobacteriales bacterium]|jgi:hypothetical protein